MSISSGTHPKLLEAVGLLAGFCAELNLRLGVTLGNPNGRQALNRVFDLLGEIRAEAASVEEPPELPEPKPEPPLVFRSKHGRRR